MTRPPHRALTAFLLVTLALAGCNILGPMGYFIAGPAKREPLFNLDPARTSVVFIDDRESRIGHSALRRQMSAKSEEVLLEKAAVVDLLSSDAVLASTVRDRFGQPRSIVTIGREIGAEVVIYATIDSFSLSPDGVSLRPTATARLKVIDVTEDKRVWPVEPQRWHSVTATVPRVGGEMPTSVGARMEMLSVLADRMGQEIAHVFVKHLADPSETEVGR